MIPCRGLELHLLPVFRTRNSRHLTTREVHGYNRQLNCGNAYPYAQRFLGFVSHNSTPRPQRTSFMTETPPKSSKTNNILTTPIRAQAFIIKNPRRHSIMYTFSYSKPQLRIKQPNAQPPPPSQPTPTYSAKSPPHNSRTTHA